MEKITKGALKKILESHERWLETEGKYGKRAVLDNIDFRGMEFDGINLRWAEITNCDFRGAMLPWANFQGAIITNVTFSRADFHNYFGEGGADFGGATLEKVRFIGAELANAQFDHTRMSEVCFVRANLERAYCCAINQFGDNFDEHGKPLLETTDFSGANLRGADFEYATLIDPDSNFDWHGHLSQTEWARLGIKLDAPRIGYKQGADGEIITLEIPAGAIVCSINNYKCRTATAKVLKIVNTEGHEVKEARSNYDEYFVYHLGETITVDNFDPRYNVECGAGLHFFWSEEEARDYDWN